MLKVSLHLTNYFFVTYVKTSEHIFPQPNFIKSACVETDVLIRLVSLGNQTKINYHLSE